MADAGLPSLAHQPLTCRWERNLLSLLSTIDDKIDAINNHWSCTQHHDSQQDKCDKQPNMLHLHAEYLHAGHGQAQALTRPSVKALLIRWSILLTAPNNEACYVHNRLQSLKFKRYNQKRDKKSLWCHQSCRPDHFSPLIPDNHVLGALLSEPASSASRPGTWGGLDGNI